jgi:hypothetical protein
MMEPNPEQTMVVNTEAPGTESIDPTPGACAVRPEARSQKLEAQTPEPKPRSPKPRYGHP